MEEGEEIKSYYQCGGQTMSEGYLTHQKGVRVYVPWFTHEAKQVYPLLS